MPDPGRTADPRAHCALERLRTAKVNFDPSTLSAGAGWQYDERLQELPDEAPGRPAANGSWAVARRLMRGYEFADPSIVRAFYDREAPLEGRDMLLQVRFHVLRFRVGCRVASVYEHDEEVDGRDATIWGWSYRTLEGHFEQGEMHWQVLKWPSGEVAFRIRAWSRRANDPNPLIRLGFRLFGRREQLRFYHSTCERMERLTREALRAEGDEAAFLEVARRSTARPAPEAEPDQQELAKNADPSRKDAR
ncbi:MAG TPA: DUF1990 family protein [Thermoleophilaceae bacterium]|nr:DUF1990 family protein [Thermoleophilaceae bacterium]